jgi:electron transfer flavoprotein beta subunit
MKIVVCAKHVPAGTLRLSEGGDHLDRTGPGELNRTDKNAIEEALKLKDSASAEVVVLTMGPHEATESLRTALAMGADRAVHVNDAAIVGSDLLATSRVLAAAIARESADLVLFGQQTTDGGGALLWSAIAERLSLPYASQASKLTVADGTAQIERETEVGDEVIDVALPALVAVSDAVNEPRYTSLKGTMAAKKKPLEVLTLADLGIDAAAVGAGGSATVVRSLGAPPAREGSVTIDDEAGAAAAIVDYLVARELV